MGKYKRTKKGVNIQLNIDVIEELEAIGKDNKWTLSQVLRELINLTMAKKLHKEL